MKTFDVPVSFCGSIPHKNVLHVNATNQAEALEKAQKALGCDSVSFNSGIYVKPQNHVEVLSNAQAELDGVGSPQGIEFEYSYLRLLKSERCFIFKNGEIAAKDVFELLGLQDVFNFLSLGEKLKDYGNAYYYVQDLKEKAVKEAESEGGKLFFDKSEARMFLLENVGSTTAAIKDCPFLAALKKMEIL